MNITNVTITRTAEEKTENAFYMLEYSTVNDELNHLHVSVNEKEADEEGNIKPVEILEYGTKLPHHRKVAGKDPIFQDFDRMQQDIREKINPK